MADYDYLSVGNGSGDAALMHITTDRTVGATTIVVDSVTNVPAKFIATSGTLLASGLIDPTTARNFKGHTSAGTLIIDAFEPGSTDAGNTAGQVVVVKPNTGWANRVASFIKNATGSGTPEAVTFSSVAVDTITEETSGHGVSVAGVNHKGSAIADSSGNAVVEVGGVASAVNHVKATNAATGGAPSLTPIGTDTDIYQVITGKGVGKVLAQLPIYSTGLSGTTGVLGSIAVPAMPVACKVLLLSWVSANLGAGAPTQSFLTEIKIHGGATLTGTPDNTKSAAAGISESRLSTLIALDSLPASTARTYDCAQSTGWAVSGTMVALVVAA